VPESAYPVLLEAIQMGLGLVGQAFAQAGSLTWRHSGSGEGGRNLVVTVTRAGGRTRVHIEEHFEGGGWRRAGPVVAATVMGVVTASALRSPEAVIPALLLAMLAFGGLTLLGDYVVASAVERRRPELERLGDHLAMLARDAVGRGLGPGRA
jgi:hypothetical protein